MQAGILPGWTRSEYIVVASLLSIPFACLRNLKHLAFGALVADAAVLFGLITIFGCVGASSTPLVVPRCSTPAHHVC